MKKKFLLLVCITGLIHANAQSNAFQAKSTSADFYFGVQSGIESFTGLIGITADYRVKNNFYIRAGAGIGSWGGKVSAGIRNEKSSGKGLGYGLSLSYASGLKNFTTQLETTTGKKDVKLDLLPGYTLVPTISYKWVTARRNRFFLEGGYAVPLQNNPWTIKDGSVLSETGKSTLKILSPGGFSLGLGFQFAL